jgi:hypothetical protein
MADLVTAEWAIVEPGFTVPTTPRFLVVQPDWGVHVQEAHTGERLYRVENREAALHCCEGLAERAADEHASFVVIPELAVPVEGVGPFVASFTTPGPDIVVMAGVEGTTRTEYQDLLASHNLPAADLSDGSYVNSLLVLVRRAGVVSVRFRVKKHPSTEERQGLEPCRGTEPYVIPVLGPRSATVIPLLCSELLDANIYAALDQQCQAVGLANADYFVVLQLNNNPAGGYFSDKLRQAFAPTGRSLRTHGSRFVLANHALGRLSDGRSCVVVHPQAVQRPPFALNQSVYWEDFQGYAGFRIPDGTGCMWWADVLLPCEGAGPTGGVVCNASVFSVGITGIEGHDAGGLAHGLLRVECRRQLLALASRREDLTAQTGRQGIEVVDAILSVLSPGNERFVLSGMNREAAQSAMHRMQCSGATCPDRLTWENVEQAAREYIEVAALLGAGGASVRIHGAPPFDNCAVEGRGMLVILGNCVEEAVTHRFVDGALMASPNCPLGVVLVVVHTDTSRRSIRSILKADRVTGVTDGLQGAPDRAREADSTLPPDPHLCSLPLLRQAGRCSTRVEAAGVLTELLPEVFHAES